MSYVIHYRDGSKQRATSVVGTNLLDGPDGATGWWADLPNQGYQFIAREDVLVIRDLRYPADFDTIWDSRTESNA